MSDAIRLLLVDDDDDDRVLAMSMLTHGLADIEVTEAQDALEFAQAYATGPFDLVIAEHELGWATGPELLSSLKRKHPACVTLLFSATEPAAAKLRNATIDATLQKSSGGFVELPKLVGRLLAEGPSARREFSPSERLVQTLPLPVLGLRSTGEISSGNEALATALGFSSVPDLIGLSFPALVVEHGQRVAVERALAEGHELDLPAVTLETADGSRFVGRVCVFSTRPNGVDNPGSTDDAAQGLLILGPAQGPAIHPVSPPDTSADGGPTATERNRVSATFFGELQDPIQLLGHYAQASAQSLKDGASEQAQAMLERIETISNQIQRMLRAMNHYAGSRPQHAPHFGEVALSHVFSDALRQLDSEIASTGAKITAEALPVVIGNRAELVFLVQQLLENSLKFRHTDTPVIRINAEERPNDWLLTFQDNGIGMPPGSTERAFDLFERLHDSDTYPGSGVGLAICRDIANRHGGDIWADAAQPRGTRFRITVSKHLTAGAPSDRNEDAHDPPPLGDTG